MIVLINLIGKGMRSMRNLCEMYAKCMRKIVGLNAMVLFKVFGVFLGVL